MAITSVTGVLCCGNVVFDIAVWPVENCDWSTTTWVETISEGIGGNGANTSYALARLGVPVRLASIVGSDVRGQRLLDILTAVGVDVASVARSDAQPTPATVVLVHTEGDRKFLHRPGASRDLSASAIPLEPGRPYSHFHLANPFAFTLLRNDAPDLLRRFKDAGMTTSIDTGWDSKGRWIMDLGSCLPHTDLLFTNDVEARMLGGSDDLEAAIRVIRARGVSDVIVKVGQRGCLICEDDANSEISGFRVNAIDSTGAGDCFVGGFLAGLYRGWNYPECAEFANAVGAMSVQSLGATAGLRSFDDSLLWMRGNRRA